MQAPTLIQAYTELAEQMSQMLAAARQNDWETVSALEVDYLDKVAQIKTLERSSMLTADTKTQKSAIIQRILADDQQLRLLIHPWMDKLSALIQSSQSSVSHMQAKLNSAYQV